MQAHITAAQGQAICRLALAAIGVLNAVPTYRLLTTQADVQRYLQRLQEGFGAADVSASADEPLLLAVQGGSQTLQPLWWALTQHSQLQELGCFIAASWLRVSMGFDGKGDLIVLEDPAAAALLQVRFERWDHIDDLMAGYLAVERVFPPLVASNPQLVQRLTYWLTAILANGMSTALQTFLLETTDYAAMPRLAPTPQRSTRLENSHD